MECGMSSDVLMRRVGIDMQGIYGLCRSFVCGISFLNDNGEAISCIYH
jgi:hypothetical protein